MIGPTNLKAIVALIKLRATSFYKWQFVASWPMHRGALHEKQ
jgi:hypothetical protein